MAVVSWSSVARQDLASIRDYHERSSPGYTRVILNKIFAAVTGLELFPRMGREIPEIEDEAFREMLVEGYRIVYLVTGEGEHATVEVLTIAHGRQDLIKKLSRRS